MTGRKRMATVLALFLAMGGSTSMAATTQGGRAGGPTPPRLSFIDGEVSFWRPGADDWAPATVNTPVAAGDSLYTGDNANLELEVGAGAFVRAGAATELSLESLEGGLTQFKVTSGHAGVDVRRLPAGRAIEIDTPNGAFTIDHPGYYRVDVDENRTTFATRRGGQATLVPANGDATDIGPDKQAVLEGEDTPQIATSAAPDPDEWDRWNLDRSGNENQPSRSAQYVPPDVAGSGDLDRAGDWRNTPRYGHVWVPRDVPPDWAPYSTGRWVWDPYYGWTWVDDAPWGWAPYHYGRWVYADNYWGWAPGPVVVAPAYSPALVAFVGPSVSVSVGAFPFVGWVALGFGEPVVPWWGPVGFVGTCWWGGWGGPHIVNNVVIQKNVFVNVRNVNVFQNQHVRNAVIAERRDHFGRGHAEHVHLAGADARHLRPFHGQLGVKPVAASLVAREGHGHAPPNQVHARPVVATRAPQDFSRRLHAEGLNPASNAAPPPRLAQHVPQSQPRGGRGGGRGEPGSFSQRSAPPPPRGSQRQFSGVGARPEPPQHARSIERSNPGSQRQGEAPPPPRASAQRPPHEAGGRDSQAPPLPPRSAQGRASQERAPQERASQGRAPKERFPQGNGPQRNATQGNVPRREGGSRSGAPPPRMPGEGASAQHSRQAPHGNQQHQPGPGARVNGFPSHAWASPAPEHFHGSAQGRPQRRGGRGRPV
jgi:uncharacterized protein DUF6600